MNRLAIIDLDKVVSNSSARFARATRPDYSINWKIALDPDLVELDELIERADIALDVITTCDYHILFLTGRPETMREATVQWMLKYGLPVHEMVMRTAGDFSKAKDFKRREVAKIVAEKQPDKVLFIDDLIEEYPDLLFDCAVPVVCHASLADYMLYSL